MNGQQNKQPMMNDTGLHLHCTLSCGQPKNIIIDEEWFRLHSYRSAEKTESRDKAIYNELCGGALAELCPCIPWPITLITAMLHKVFETANVQAAL